MTQAEGIPSFQPEKVAPNDPLSKEKKKWAPNRIPQHWKAERGLKT